MTTERDYDEIPYQPLGENDAFQWNESDGGAKSGYEDYIQAILIATRDNTDTPTSIISGAAFTNEAQKELARVWADLGRLVYESPACNRETHLADLEAYYDMLAARLEIPDEEVFVPDPDMDDSSQVRASRIVPRRLHPGQRERLVQELDSISQEIMSLHAKIDAAKRAGLHIDYGQSKRQFARHDQWRTESGARYQGLPYHWMRLLALVHASQAGQLVTAHTYTIARVPYGADGKSLGEIGAIRRIQDGQRRGRGRNRRQQEEE